MINESERSCTAWQTEALVPPDAVNLVQSLRLAQTEEPQLAEGELTVHPPAAEAPAVLHNLSDLH